MQHLGVSRRKWMFKLVILRTQQSNSNIYGIYGVGDWKNIDILIFFSFPYFYTFKKILQKRESGPWDKTGYKWKLEKIFRAIFVTLLVSPASWPSRSLKDNNRDPSVLLRILNFWIFTSFVAITGPVAFLQPKREGDLRAWKVTRREWTVIKLCHGHAVDNLISLLMQNKVILAEIWTYLFLRISLQVHMDSREFLFPSELWTKISNSCPFFTYHSLYLHTYISAATFSFLSLFPCPKQPKQKVYLSQ